LDGKDGKAVCHIYLCFFTVYKLSFFGHRSLIKNTNTNSSDKKCATVRFYAKFDVSMLRNFKILGTTI